MDIWQILLAIGLPSALIGLLIRRIEKRLDREREEREEHEKSRREYESYQIHMLTAVAKLSEANSIALKNGKCNGETSAALEYLREEKHNQRDFLIKHGLEHLF